MSEIWPPVLLAAVIVLGVIGGTVVQMVLKELLPLLRSIAEGRIATSATDRARPLELPASLERRLGELESGQRELKEETEFLQRLLTERDREPALPRGDSEGGGR